MERLGQIFTCKRYLARSSFTRSVQKRVHRRLWSFLVTERIKVGSVPTFFFLFQRVNARSLLEPICVVFSEPVVLVHQLFTVNLMRFTPSCALHLRGSMADKKKEAPPRKAATKAVDHWKVYEVAMLLVTFF